MRTSERLVFDDVEDVDEKLDGDAGVENVADHLRCPDGSVDERTAVIQIPHFIIITLENRPKEELKA
jgi:hypothetical protein